MATLSARGSLAPGTWVVMTLFSMLLSTSVGATVLEQRMVLVYKCEVNAATAELAISGNNSGSALFIKRVKKARAGSDLIIEVRLGTFGNGPQAFHEKIAITPELNRVLFGKERALVWSREGGCAPSS